MTPLMTPEGLRTLFSRHLKALDAAARAVTDALLPRYGAHAQIGFACGAGILGTVGRACAEALQSGGVLTGVNAAGIAPRVWVDALFDTPEDRRAKWIERLTADREKGSAVVALGLPAGLDGLTGHAGDPCVRADLTLCIQHPLAGCVLADGLDATGELVTLDLGLSDGLSEDSPALIDASDVRRMLTPRPRNFHKGNAGHLLIVAGSMGMAGAAAMCAMSAMRTGAGLVTVACPASIVPILQTLVPCAMCVPLPESDGALSASAAEALDAILPGKTAVMCGCGLSRRASPEVVHRVLGCDLPALLDADALNLISGNAELKALLRPHHLITPHPGEAARLLGRPMSAPLADALALHALGCQALLKGAATVIPVGKRPVISASGTSGMAKGGSGDCLSGVIGALMAQTGRDVIGDALALCAAVGSELHGVAGEIACAKHGIRGMIPLDLIEALPEALNCYA